MKILLPFLHILTIGSLAFAQLDELPPPPGYSDPAKPPRVRPGSPAGESAQPHLRGSVLVFADPADDLREGETQTYLNLREVTLTRLSDTMLAANITFAEPMPTVTEEGKYSIIFFSLDLDRDASTGKLYNKLGIDLGIKLKGYDAHSPWESTVNGHTDLAREFGISVAQVTYTGQTVSLILRTEGSRKLEHFGLQIAAMANYRSVDVLPDQPPLFIDLTLVEK